MICDEDYLSSALDKPKSFEHNENIFSPTEEIVSYNCSLDQKVWTKTIKLEQCGRSDLTSLLTFISCIQKISPIRMYSSENADGIRINVNFGSYLPASIHLTGSDLTFCYQFSKSGCVHDLLKPYFVDGGLPESIVQAIFSRAVRSLNQLHKNGWIHRSICARHILLYQPADEDSTLDIAFCGVGSIVPVSPLGSPLNRTDVPVIDARWRGWHYQNLQDNIYSTHPVAWYSPEMVAQDFEGYGKPSDIYSLGLTLAEMFTGVAPFVGTITPSLIFLKKMTLKEPLQLPCSPGQTASAEMISVFESCTRFDASQRPTAEELLGNEWVKQGLATSLKESLLTRFRLQ
ncbi:unnamed protein product [Hymenolepis diminuta]|uniref:Protein kinase domain-containing protein n=2 Tax=Hymenolepis diminuta TaxID=6216 RepID=A0A564Z6X6_HYMDI|nr:unnamed protein product [Hymenolepis diminuta]